MLTAALSFTLSGFDVEKPPLTDSVYFGPSHSTLRGRVTNPALTLGSPLDGGGCFTEMISLPRYIESGFNVGEFAAFDVRLDGGGNWSQLPRKPFTA